VAPTYLSMQDRRSDDHPSAYKVGAPYVRKDKLKGIVNLHSWKYLRTLPPHVMFWFNFTLCPTNDLITQAKGGVGLSPAIKFRVLVGRDFDLTWKLSPIRGPRIM
jgi:hypothetical protein